MVKYLMILLCALLLFPGADLKSVYGQNQEADAELPTDGLNALRIGQGINGAVMGASFAYFAEETIDLGIVGIPLLPASIAGGVLWPKKYSDEYGITHSEAAFINGSSLWGIGMGASLGLAFGGKDDDIYVPLFIMIMNAGATSASVSYTNKKERELTSGEVSIVASSAFWGAFGSLGLAKVVGVEKGETGALFIGGGLALGAVGGFYIQSRQEWKKERMLQVNLATLGGLMAGLGLTALFTRNWRIRWVGSIIGMVAGATLGVYISRNMEHEEEAPVQNKIAGEYSIVIPAMAASF